MSTQRLDLPCSFARKDASRSQPVRPPGLSIEKPIEAKSSGCSLRQNIKLPPVATEGRRENKDDFGRKVRASRRYAGEVSYDHEESYMSRVKRKRGNGKSDGSPVEEGHLSLGQLSSDNFWFHPGFNVPRSVPQVTGLSTTQVPFSLSCSGEEERVCFVPSDVIAPPLPPLSNIPWFDSVVTEITDLGDKNVETIKGPEKEASGSSSTSSGSQRWFLGWAAIPWSMKLGMVHLHVIQVKVQKSL
ncbi:UNVERIFIED_CONTAM: Scarecrow-like protein 28 [Sesamum radiatum]|uniref:Scarecrow-like protein 28 n=1 Tax=Sesamum radiatum TaxID=300843 RepID=A0AAW2JHB4_SESRA